MFLAKVIGTVVANQKHPSITGIKLLIVQPVDEFDQPIKEPVVAIDGTAMAGPGEMVWCVSNREGALAIENWFNPCNHGILGIVDEVCVVVDGARESTYKSYE